MKSLLWGQRKMKQLHMQIKESTYRPHSIESRGSNKRDKRGEKQHHTIPCSQNKAVQGSFISMKRPNENLWLLLFQSRRWKRCSVKDPIFDL